jgi:ABC-2 type transport system permease protein
MIERVLAIARKEVFQIWRDKRSLGLLAFVPTFTLLLFGFALNLDMKNVRLAVVDEDRSTASRRFIGSFLRSDYFAAVAELPSRASVTAAIESNLSDVVVVIPSDFSEGLLRGDIVTVQGIVDGSNPTLAAAAAGYLDAFTGQYNARIRSEAVARTGRGGYLPVDYRPRVWFNPELKSSRYLVPGLMGYIMIISTVISTALSIVREKERGTIEQIQVSPVGTAEFVIGKIIPYFVIACILATGIVLAGWLLFDVPVRGSIPLLAGGLLLFIAGGLGMGLMISTVARTQEAAFLLATVATALPTQLLSGFIFPIENMPVVLRAVTTIVPAKYLLIVLRGILLKGAPLESYWASYMALGIFAVVTITGAIVRLKKV